MAHTVDNKADNKRMKSSSMTQFNLEQHSSTEELLPGIHNEITVQRISTKLPWITVHTLSSVSRAWRAAVRSRELFDARVRAHSTNTLVVINHTLSCKTLGISLYSMQARACYRLPPIPYVMSGIPKSCKCVTLDGKIYILGGLQGFRLGSKEVYMFDVAGQGGWKKCASMHVARQDFACGAVNGKIYVCGGTSCCMHPGRAPVCGMEIYDPKTDKWTTIMPMPSWRACHDVGIIGDELLVYGGVFINLDVKQEEVIYGPFRTPQLKYTCWRSDDCLEVYNTKEDRWRKAELKTYPASSYERFFIADGRLHSISPSTIFVFDCGKNTKACLQSSLLWTPYSPTAYAVPITVVAVDHELLVISDWTHYPDYKTRILFQSRGFGMGDRTVVWEQPETPFSFYGLRSPFMVPLHV
ncbi:unnamed protein product [Calypogeia fissa]